MQKYSFLLYLKFKNQRCFKLVTQNVLKIKVLIPSGFSVPLFVSIFFASASATIKKSIFTPIGFKIFQLLQLLKVA